jgi:hypothetical protein
MVAATTWQGLVVEFVDGSELADPAAYPTLENQRIGHIADNARVGRLEVLLVDFHAVGAWVKEVGVEC